MTDNDDTLTLTRTYEFIINESDRLNIYHNDAWQYAWSPRGGLMGQDGPQLCSEAEERKLAQAAADYWAAHK